jgi:mono/diheme cytochrome c family protein
MFSQPTLPLATCRSIVLLGNLLSAATIHAAENDQQFDATVRPFLVKHCVECHQGDKPKGDLRLDQAAPDLANDELRQQWLDVIERVRKGEMPPKAKPRPSDAEIAALTGWVNERVRAFESAERATHGRVVLRRLNRIEYENTIRDLFGISISLREQLPADGTANGFDNAGAALHTSSFLMERYLEAADTALNEAICNRPEPPKKIAGRYSIAESYVVKRTTESVYRHLEDSVVCFCSSEWHNVIFSPFYPPDGGNYRFRISASGYQSNGKPIPYRVTAGRTRLTGKSGLVGYFDGPADQPRVVEFVQYMEPKTTIALLPYGLTGANIVKQTGADKWEGPGLAVQYIEVEGPLHDSWPPESHRRLFGDLKQKKAPAYNQSTRVEVTSNEPLVDADRIVRKFARRAFRRPVTDADIKPFVDIVEKNLAAEYTFEQAVRAALKGVLMSPEFLFLRENPGKLNDFALANRLSYFFWSTMPDEELFTLAEQNKLHEPTVLREQVERLLKHPKAVAFTDNFVGQWLGLREIDATEPSHILYPEFDHALKVSMIRETELFFDELLKHDLSVTNFVASEFSMLNGRLGKHYGIPGLDGWEFRKTTLPPESHRGGVLTMGSVLKVTANGTTTSPVLRGAWILDRILGTPPSPPPPDVTVLDPDIRGATTIREQLAKHRSVPACSSCHTTIDPPGFALESFDCIGGWRDNYRVTGSGKSVVIDGRRMAYHEGKPVDPSDVMPDGQKFANVDQFKQILLQNPDQLARSLATKLLTYATGAAPTSSDQPAIEKIVSDIRGKQHGLRSLVHEVVQSEVFRTK